MTASDRDDATPHDDAPTRGRRRRIALVVLLVLAVLLGGLLRWATRPQQVAGLVLSQAGRALGLNITARGVSEYTVRGVPQLVLRDVVAQREGDAMPVLRAERLLLAVPWSTLKSRGRDLTVHRVELARPRLDIGALQRWLATRPPSPQRALPTLTDGFVVSEGIVDGDGWRIEALDVDVPRLALRLPVRATLEGRAVTGETRVPFAVAATLARPVLPAGLGVAGRVEVKRPEWSLPMNVVLRGSPDLRSGLAVDRLVLGARARYVSSGSDLPFDVGIAGRARYADGLHLAPLGFATRRGRALPDVTVAGRLDWTRSLAFAVDGRLERWPDAWPALPDPIARPRGPLPMQLAYAGATDLSGEASLRLTSGATRFDSRFRLPRVLDWLDADDRDTPLPPLDGHMSTPRLAMPGATLHGIEIELSDDAD